MALIFESGFNIKRGQEEAFQVWEAENEARTREVAPDGVEYLGTYIVQFTSEKNTGEYRTLWRLDSFAALDAMEDAARDPNSEWGRLSRESSEFMDLPIGAEHSATIMQPLVGALIWDIS